MMPAPAWQLRDPASGTPAPDLRQFEGKPLLLLFFHYTCLGCMGRALPLARYYARHYPELQLISIHPDLGRQPLSDPELLALAQEQQLAFPVYADPGAETYARYEAGGTPHWVLIGPEGQILNSIFGSMDDAQNRLYYSLLELFGRE